MGSYAQFTGQDALDWLRQKLRTSTANEGEWSQAILLRYTNQAVREVVDLLTATPWQGYFLRVLAGGIPDADGFLQIDDPNTTDPDYGVIRVPFVRYSLAGQPVAHAALAGKFIPHQSIGRVVWQAEVAMGHEESQIDTQRFFHIETLNHTLVEQPADGLVYQVKIENWTELAAVRPIIDVHYYSYPHPLDEAAVTPSTEILGIPAIAYNTVMYHAALIALEDDRNDVAYAMVEKGYERARAAMLQSAMLHYDLPAMVELSGTR